MSRIPEELKYTKTHEWFSVDAGVATIGISDYAQQQLTDIVYIDMPKPGDDKKLGMCF